MSHAAENKESLVARVRRMKGQVEAIDRALESGAESEKIIHLIAAVRGAAAALMAEMLEHHVRSHLIDDANGAGALSQEAADQLVALVRTYLR